MGLFSKKEDCPVCGGEVKGMFLTQIANKKTLCKNCGKRISMNEDLLKTASPEFVRQHLVYRQQNAEKFASLYWDNEYTSIPGFKFGVNLTERVIYMIHDKLNDEDNPVVFSFDQVMDYELYRLKKKVDSVEEEGPTALESGLTVLAAVSDLISKDNTNDVDYFKLKLKTTDPYWENIELKISFTRSQLYGFYGFADEMKTICQILKKIVRREDVSVL